MNEFKGTKGQWKIKSLINTGETSIVTDTHRICDVKHFDEQIDEVLLEPTYYEGKLNALLISKAPEMLEMLQNVCTELYKADNPLATKVKKLIQEATEL